MKKSSKNQLSPLLRFRAKSEMADFSIPIEIPTFLEPLGTNQRNGDALLS